MNELQPRRFRHRREAGFALVLLTVAVSAGYAMLAPYPRASATHRAVTDDRPGESGRGDSRSAGFLLTTVPQAEATVTEARKPAAATLASLVPAPDPVTGPQLPDVSAPRWATPDPGPAPRPWPARVAGRVLAPDRSPVAGASVVAARREIRTDATGAFELEHLPPGTPVVVKVPGHHKVTIAPTPGPIGEVVLRPHAVKAAYLTYYGIGDRGIRGRVYDLLARTELNAVVIDVKGDRGWIPWRTEVPAARAAGAQGPVILRDVEGMLADLRARNVYTIARIVVFKDNVLATSRPDLAIVDTRTGRPWQDRENLAWVDPFREEVWRYNVEIAKEALAKGFDEIQFDYVRFPTDGKLSAARYARTVSKETRLPTIAGFLAFARRELGAHGAFVAADIFGYTAFNDNDTDIGQRIEDLAPHVDYLSPMVYPSGYHLGIPGYRNPVANPYQVVHESVRMIRRRSGGHPVKIRPWLQDFKDYAFDRRIFGVAEIRAQIKGSDDAGGVGWMLWNPRNDYTAAALRSKSPVATR